MHCQIIITSCLFRLRRRLTALECKQDFHLTEQQDYAQGPSDHIDAHSPTEARVNPNNMYAELNEGYESPVSQNIYTAIYHSTSEYENPVGVQ